MTSVLAEILGTGRIGPQLAVAIQPTCGQLF
jgi:hypothetical protein